MLYILSFPTSASQNIVLREIQSSLKKVFYNQTGLGDAESFALCWRFTGYINTLKALRGAVVKKVKLFIF